MVGFFQTELKELEKLRENLDGESISGKEAIEALKRYQGKKLWGSKAWKQARETFISTQCAQCSSTEGPMVLQHLTLPLRMPQVIREWRRFIRRQRWLAWQDANPIDEVKKPRNVCPRCRYMSVWQRNRRDSGRWACTRCHADFDAPAVELKKDTSAMRDLKAQRWSKFLASDAASYAEDDEEKALRHAAQYAIANRLSYLSLRDCATFCKKCAFLWDQKEMKLCRTCKSKFHQLHYDVCFQCADGTKTLTARGGCEDVNHAPEVLAEPLVQSEAPQS